MSPGHTIALVLYVLASFCVIAALVVWEIDRHRYVEPLPHVDFVQVLITVDTSQFRRSMEQVNEAMRRVGAAARAAGPTFAQLGRMMEAACIAEEERRVREHNKLIGYDPDEWALRMLGGDRP